jgi:hypothetical protein
MTRPVCIHHCTSEPYRFFGRAAELQLLDRALAGGEPSVLALVGPGGQGKTAIVQHWLKNVVGRGPPDGVFLWSFYRGKDVDLCLRELYACAAKLDQLPDVAASYAVDRLLEMLRRECWAVVLDGTEVVQYDDGPWRGRFVHPELGRLVEELASESLPGVVVVTTRFELPTLVSRKHARIVSLQALDPESARGLLESLGVRGSPAELDEVAGAGGHHAKAVELLGTYLVRFHEGDASRLGSLPESVHQSETSAEEQGVARVLAAYQRALPADLQDLIALATAFRDPPVEARLLEYLGSPPVGVLLHRTWGRTYQPYAERACGELSRMLEGLVKLRLLERVGRGTAGVNPAAGTVIDAHPLVRRAFAHQLGAAGQRQSASARAGFLHARPDRRRPETLDQAREEVELFHAYCDAGLWNEADSAFVALDNPKHRFLAPVLERDLLLRFFPGGDWRRTPLWPGFGRYRSLAISCEMLGQWEDALSIYREADAPLRGDALIALGRLGPLLVMAHAPHPWQTLWQAYRAHALSLAGSLAEAVALARGLVPVDVYEWVHVFECLLRAGRLETLDLKSLQFRSPLAGDHRWAELARRRMRADYLRLAPSIPPEELGPGYAELVEAYDRGGLPWERALTRLSWTAWLLAQRKGDEARRVNQQTLALARQSSMPIVEADAWDQAAQIARLLGIEKEIHQAQQAQARIRAATGHAGPARP